MTSGTLYPRERGSGLSSAVAEQDYLQLMQNAYFTTMNAAKTYENSPNPDLEKALGIYVLAYDVLVSNSLNPLILKMIEEGKLTSEGHTKEGLELKIRSLQKTLNSDIELDLEERFELLKEKHELTLVPA